MNSKKQHVENVNQAISVLIQAAHLGLQKGIFSFEEVRLLAEAIDFFLPEKEEENSNISANINPTSEQKSNLE